MSHIGSSILLGPLNMLFRLVVGHPIFSRVIGVDSPKEHCTLFLSKKKNATITDFYSFCTFCKVIISLFETLPSKNTTDY